MENIPRTYIQNSFNKVSMLQVHKFQLNKILDWTENK